MTTSAQRPTLNRPEVMEKLKSTARLGRVIALKGLLKLVSHMSLEMQTVNAVPWEPMDEQRAFYDKLVEMEAALRERPKDSDPRWSTIPPSPFTSTIFPFYHEEPDPTKNLGQSRVQILLAGTYMGQALIVPEEERAEGATDEFAHLEATFDLSYDVAKWLECMCGSLFPRPFLARRTWHARNRKQVLGPSKIHGIDCTSNRVSSRYLRGHQGAIAHNTGMDEGGGLQDIPDIDVVYEQAMLLARGMEKGVIDFYKGCTNPNTACHK